MNALSPHTDLLLPRMGYDDLTILKLAREIAMDIRPLEDILASAGVDDADWEAIRANPGFTKVLRRSVEEWNSAVNTQERVRLKTLAIVEEALPEFYARAHDSKEALQHKVKLLEVFGKFAGIGGVLGSGESVADRLTVTINLGADQQLRIEKDVTPQGNLIEGEAT